MRDAGEDVVAALGAAEIVVHTSFSGLLRAWRELEVQADCYVFQTWSWNLAWYRNIGRHTGVKLRIVELRQRGGGAPVALWPLCVYRRGGLRVLGFIGDVVSDYRAPLFSREWLQAEDAAAFSELWEACLDAIEDKVDLVLLSRMPEHFERLHNPMAGLQGSRHVENAYMARLPATPEEYFTRRSTRMMAEIRRKVRRLQDLGDYRVGQVTEDDWETVFHTLVCEKSRRWRESGSRDLFADRNYVGFYRTMTRHGLHDGMVSMTYMRVGDTVTAVHWGLVLGGRYCGVLSGFESGSWKKYSCGEILMQYEVERAIRGGLRILDFTVGEEAYKKSWATEQLCLYQWRCARTLRGSLYLLRVRTREWARSVGPLRRCVQYIRNLRSRRGKRLSLC